MDDKTTLEFASLLHDIGKFYQRARGLKKKIDYRSDADVGKIGAHSRLSSKFVDDYLDDDFVSDLVLYHHNSSNSFNKKLGDMIKVADHQSSFERAKIDEHQEVLEQPLISIFSEININNNEECDDKYIPLDALNLNQDSLEKYPKRKEEVMSGWNLEVEYKNLWQNFEKEVESLDKLSFNTLLALLKKYTSSIPSAVYSSEPRISLYDHLKTTTAIATCRYLYEEETHDLKTTDNQEVYLIVSGDLSGIQDFIFKVSSPAEAQSGMSKRLRGRSLYLNLLSDSIASHIIDKLELNQTNLLFCGGGRFTILAPNTKKAINELKTIKKEINNYLINKFNAELYLALVWEVCSGYNLRDYGKTSCEVSKKLSNDKKHKFLENLEDLFKVENSIKHVDLCPVCGLPFNKTENNKFCKECEDHSYLGGKVANAEYMIKVKTDNGDNFDLYIPELKIGYMFEENSNFSIDKLANECQQVDIIRLNNTNFLKDVDENNYDNVSYSFSFLGNIIPKYNSIPLYFEDLAKISKGANKIGVLKMDVDNLGKIFIHGFKKDEGEDKTTISKISTLSSQFDYFFSGLINEIAKQFKVYANIGKEDKSKFDLINLEREGNRDSINLFKPKDGEDIDEQSLKQFEIPTIYINFAGGDDLLVVGPYDDIIKFSMIFKEYFKKWTADNPSINISAGISIVSPKFPIGKSAILAEEALEDSKSCGRNKITLFGETVNWQKDDINCGFKDLFEFGLDLEDYVTNEELSKGVIYSIFRLWQETFGDSSSVHDQEQWMKENLKRINTKRFVPKLVYKMRLTKNPVKDEVTKKMIKYMPWINIPVSWVSLRMRRFYE